VSHSNDNIGILNKTVLQNVIKGLQDMHNGGRFIARLEDNNKIEYLLILWKKKIYCAILPSGSLSMVFKVFLHRCSGEMA
jgi:hypothetical protein